MNRLTIFIVSGIFLLASGARAEIVNLYCELSKEKKATITGGNETFGYANPLSNLEIIIDTKKEEILKAPRVGKYWAKDMHEEIWDSTIISWGSKKSSKSMYAENFFLNRYTLKLKSEEKREGFLHEVYYDCNKTKKKI